MNEVVVDKYGNLKDGRETVMVNGVGLPNGNHPQANIARANTALLADAINTERKTGLTPLQLAEQRAELLGALKDAKEKLKWFVESYPHDLAKSEQEFFANIDDALEKCK